MFKLFHFIFRERERERGIWIFKLSPFRSFPYTVFVMENTKQQTYKSQARKAIRKTKQ